MLKLSFALILNVNCQFILFPDIALRGAGTRLLMIASAITVLTWAVYTQLYYAIEQLFICEEQFRGYGG